MELGTSALGTSLAALHLPALPLEAILRHHPEKRPHPHAVLSPAADKQTLHITHANRAARRRGIQPGLSPTRALARCPDLRFLDRDPDAEATALRDLLEIAESLTPDFELTTPDTLLLDLSGRSCPGSGQAVVAAARRDQTNHREATHSSWNLELRTSNFEQLGLPLHLATGPTPDLAHLLSLHPATSHVLVYRGAHSRWKSPTAPGDLTALPLPLLQSLHHLELGVSNLEFLHQWGLKTCADLTQLPRQGLAERLGPELARLHDLLHGKHPRLLQLFRPTESIETLTDLEHPLANSEALVLWLRRSLHTLCARLATRYRAASEIDLELFLQTPPPHRHLHHLPEPSAAPEILLRPLATHLEHLALPSPVTGFRLRLIPCASHAGQHDLFDRAIAHPHRLADTLTRLAALLGDDRLGFPVPHFTHRPDTFHLTPAHHIFHDRGCPGSGQPVRHSLDDGGAVVDAARVHTSHHREATQPPWNFELGTSNFGLPLARYRPPIEIAVAFENSRPHPIPLALLSGPHRGRITDRHGPFPLSGHWWDPAENWQHLAWDIRLDTRHLLRLTHTPPTLWHLQGSYP